MLYGDKMSKFKLVEMTWKEAEAAFKKVDTVLFPIGCCHAHDHIAVGIDNLAAEKIANLVGERTGVVKLPNLPYGWMPHYQYGVGYPGTLNVRAEPLIEVIMDVCKGLVKWGVKKVIFINGHGGNANLLETVALELREKYGVIAPILEWWAMIEDLVPEYFQPLDERAAQGDPRDVETSFAMAVNENAVDADDVYGIIRETPFLGSDKVAAFGFSHLKFKNVRVRMPQFVRETAKLGAKWTESSAEKGQKMLDALIDWCVEFVQEIMQLNVTTK